MLALFSLHKEYTVENPPKNRAGYAGGPGGCRHGRLVQPGQGNPRPSQDRAHQPRPSVLERAATRRGLPRARPYSSAGQVARGAAQQHAAQFAARAAAALAAGPGCLHGGPAQQRHSHRAGWPPARGALRPRLRPGRPLDELFRGQVLHLHPGGRRAQRRPHQEHGRQGQRLHHQHEGLGLRRCEHPPAAHHDLGRALERRLRRPQLRRGQVQQPRARSRRARHRQLPAPAAAPGPGGRALALQHG